MRHVRCRGVATRLEDWLKRVRSAKGPLISAGELYSGDHWQISASLPAAGAKQGFDASLWVISAGYGLINTRTRIHPYSAAFSPGHVDSVVPTHCPGGIIQGFQQWWTGMTAWTGPAPQQPRSIADLVRSDPKATFLVVASELYLKAAWHDLIEAGAEIQKSRTGLMLILSAGTKSFGPLADFALPVDARLQARLGGARRSLNVRMARLVLSWMTPGVGAARIRERCRRLLTSVQVAPAEQRPRCTDDEIRRFIEGEVAGTDASASALLRRFRDEDGKACEQKRFSRLYRQAREKLRA
jgi:hypothetical protein